MSTYRCQTTQLGRIGMGALMPLRRAEPMSASVDHFLKAAGLLSTRAGIRG